MSARQDTEGRIEGFLRVHFKIGPQHGGFARDIDIFERGYVDSVGVTELLEFLGAEFGVEVPDEWLLSDDFSTVEGIARIVECLRRERDGVQR
jgi:acyl carrier protein